VTRDVSERPENPEEGRSKRVQTSPKNRLETTQLEDLIFLSPSSNKALVVRSQRLKTRKSRRLSIYNLRGIGPHLSTLSP
jgi:hypothetical protein